MKMDYKPTPQTQHPVRNISSVVTVIFGVAIVALFLFSKPSPPPPKAVHRAQAITLPTTRHHKIPKPTIVKTEHVKTHTVTIKRGDTLAKIFAHLNIPAKDLIQILEIGKITRPLTNLHIGRTLKITCKPEFKKLIYPLSLTKNLIVERKHHKFQALIHHVKLKPRIHYATATIHHSLLSAGKRAGLPNKLVFKLTDIFAWDVDFTHDLRPGDQLTVIYQDYYLHDKKIKNGDILAASLSVDGRRYRAIRFKRDNGYTDYYTPEGRSLRKAFLREPIKYRRISSPFNLHRYHPILKRRRPHEGVDFAANRGTPIHASGDGRVLFRGRKGGYGRVIILKHRRGITTLYAHMSRYARHLRVGERVKQGQVIGYVGASGLATGPHLHYEFRIHGRHYNPLKVKLPKAHPIPKHYLAEFKSKTKNYLAQLELYESARLASK
jgi:murein DD-endopeptidase MepM/ murein hydrolase activator NlpD